MSGFLFSSARRRSLSGHRPISSDSVTAGTAPVKTKKRKASLRPDPSNYKILEAKELAGGFLLLKVQYPDCTNYEGMKILLFRGITLVELVNQKFIEPHFFEHKQYISPVARFVPTDEGWQMGLKLVESLTKEKP